MSPEHIEAVSAASTAASKLTYSSSAVAVAAGTASTLDGAHAAFFAGVSLGEWCAIVGALVAVGTFGLNAWDKWHARRVREQVLHMREDEHDLRMHRHGGTPTDTGDL